MILYAQRTENQMMKGQVKIMKANIKKHVIIGTLSAICIALLCVISAQFKSEKIPTAAETGTEEPKVTITAPISTKLKEEKEPVETENNAAITDRAAEIDYEEFIENGGIEVNQSFEEVTKSEAPPPPEITDEKALTDPSEPPQYETEQVEIKPQQTEQPEGTPQHGDKKDGMIYINGFGWVSDNGGGSKSEKSEEMYENGNKIGYFG